MFFEIHALEEGFLRRIFPSIFIILFLAFSPIRVYSLSTYSLRSVSTVAPDIAVVLEKGTAGTSEIGVNGTTSKVTVVASGNVEDYVDNNTSDVDSSADKGTHDNFLAQQAGPDSTYDTLTEGDTGSRVSGYRVQQGRTKLTTETQDIAITPVNSLNRAFVLLTSYYAYGQKDTTPKSGSGASVDTNVGQFLAYLYDTSAIRVERSSGATDVWITWQVIECLNEEFYVYGGSQPYSGSTTTYTVSIGGTVNGSNSLAWVNGATNDQASRSYVNRAFFTAEIGSGPQTTLTLKRGEAGTASGTVRWVVVEFNSSKIGSIQTGETTVTTQTQSARQTVSILPVNASHSILLFQIRSSANGLMQLSIAGALDSSTQISFYAHSTNNYTRYIRWYVIDFGSGCGSKQSGQIDKSADSGWYDIDRTLTTVNRSRTISFVSLTSAGTGTAFPRPFPNAYVENATNLNVWRSYYGQESWIEWQVLELPYNVGPPNYELDLEVQWTNVGYNKTDEYLCIYAGMLGSENLKVDIWSGSSWITVISALQPNQWNNVSVSSYLNASTFTIRFEGSNENGDTNKDTWMIDVTLLHVWTTESTYDYVLSTISQKSYEQEIKLTLYDSNNIGRLSNCTIWLRGTSTSAQIRIIDGTVVSYSGNWSVLYASSEQYVVVYAKESYSGSSTLSIRLEATKDNSIVYSCLIELKVN